MLATVAFLTLGGQLASAGPAEDAEKLVEAGDFQGAAAKYREAYAADPRPELICNVGVAYFKGNDFPHAFRFLEQCLASGTSLDPQFVTAVKQVIEAVDAKLRAESYTPIDISVEPATSTATIETAGKIEEPLVGSRRAWIAFGAYKITLHAEGHVDKVIEGTATTRDPIVVRERLVVKPAEPALPLGPVVPPPPAPSKVPAIAATATAVVAGSLALGLFLQARSRAEDAGAATDETIYNDAANSARGWQKGSWIAGGIGGVAAVAAGYLWYRATRSPSNVEVSASGNGAAISIRW